MRIKIVGTGSYVPECVITNEDLAGIMDTSDEWIKSRTGIRQRRISDGIGTSGMAAEAAKKALMDAGIKAEEIQLILLATSTPDCHFPSGACQVQAEIGAVHAAAYDISAACSGFIFALNTAYSFITSGYYQNILVIGVDCLSKVVDWQDRSTCVLFFGSFLAKLPAFEGGGYLGGALSEVLRCVRNGGLLLVTRAFMRSVILAESGAYA